MHTINHFLRYAVGVVFSFPYTLGMAATPPASPELAPPASASSSVQQEEPARSPDDIGMRLERIEKLLDNRAQMDMMLRLDGLEQEIRELRGEMEEQSHAIEQVRERQRDLYLDTDRRLSNVESSNAPGPQVPTPEENAGLPQVAPVPVVAPSLSTPTATTKTATAADPARERDAYQIAFNLLRELRYKEAAAAFNGFLQEYPAGQYAHIAQYWIGEANYAQRNFEDALEAYRHLLDRYPNSPKRAEAMLKIGYCHQSLGDDASARQALQGLVDAYPGTTEAGQATNLLKKLK